MIVEVGNYSINGSNVDLIVSRLPLTADVDSYTYSGVNIGIIYTGLLRIVKSIINLKQTTLKIKFKHRTN